MKILTITRVVHACVLVDFAGETILTDPWFSQRPGYYWGEPLGVPIPSLPYLAGVLVSHAHYDHYDVQAFRAYPDKQVPLAVKHGTAAAAWEAGFSNVIELDQWQTCQLGTVRITACPARHGVPENTYILEAAGFTVYFGGDTVLIPELADVARRFPRIDLALLPINGLAIRPLLNRKIVMNAEDAAELCELLQPRVAIPIHYRYRSDWLREMLLLKYDARGAPAAFVSAVTQRAPAVTVKVLEPGVPFALSGLPQGKASP